MKFVSQFFLTKTGLEAGALQQSPSPESELGGGVFRDLFGQLVSGASKGTRLGVEEQPQQLEAQHLEHQQQAGLNLTLATPPKHPESAAIVELLSAMPDAEEAKEASSSPLPTSTPLEIPEFDSPFPNLTDFLVGKVTYAQDETSNVSDDSYVFIPKGKPESTSPLEGPFPTIPIEIAPPPNIELKPIEQVEKSLDSFQKPADETMVELVPSPRSGGLDRVSPPPGLPNQTERTPVAIANRMPALDVSKAEPKVNTDSYNEVSTAPRNLTENDSAHLASVERTGPPKSTPTVKVSSKLPKNAPAAIASSQERPLESGGTSTKAPKPVETQPSSPQNGARDLALPKSSKADFFAGSSEDSSKMADGKSLELSRPELAVKKSPQQEYSPRVKDKVEIERALPVRRGDSKEPSRALGTPSSEEVRSSISEPSQKKIPVVVKKNLTPANFGSEEMPKGFSVEAELAPPEQVQKWTTTLHHSLERPREINTEESPPPVAQSEAFTPFEPVRAQSNSKTRMGLTKHEIHRPQDVTTPLPVEQEYEGPSLGLLPIEEAPSATPQASGLETELETEFVKEAPRRVSTFASAFVPQGTLLDAPEVWPSLGALSPLPQLSTLQELKKATDWSASGPELRLIQDSTPGVESGGLETGESPVPKKPTLLSQHWSYHHRGDSEFGLHNWVQTGQVASGEEPLRLGSRVLSELPATLARELVLQTRPSPELQFSPTASQEPQLSLVPEIELAEPVSSVESPVSNLQQATSGSQGTTRVPASQVPEMLAKRAQAVKLGESQKIEFQLDPDRLGRMTVELSVDPVTKQVETHLMVSTEAAREALEQQLPNLKGRLQEFGLELSTKLSTTSENHQGADTQSRGEQSDSRSAKGSWNAGSPETHTGSEVEPKAKGLYA